LTIIANAWDPDDVFNGSNILLDSRDIYLLESYLTSGNGTYQNLVDWKTKADKCVQYAAQFGVRMATLSYSLMTPNFATTSSQFNFTFFGTAMYNFDLFQMTDPSVSSADNLLFFYPKPSLNYGSTWLTDNVTQTNATHFSRQTNTSTLTLDGDGMTYGIGMTYGEATTDSEGTTNDGATTSVGTTTVAVYGCVADGAPENLFVLFSVILGFLIL
jgi:hypothetical protein